MESSDQSSSSKNKRRKKKSSSTLKKRKKRKSKSVRSEDEKEKMFTKFTRYMESSRIEKMRKYHAKFLGRDWEDYFVAQINLPFGTNGWTYLHKSASIGEIAVFKFLFRNGADLEVLDKRGNNFLHYALNYILESLDRKFLYFMVNDILGELSNVLMSQTNDYGETAVDLFDEVARLLQNSQNQYLEPESESDKEVNDKEWNERIFAEMAADDCHNNDMFFEEEHQDTFRKAKRETFEEWGNRMGEEYRQKHNKKPELPKAGNKQLGQQHGEKREKAKKRKLGPVNHLKAMRYNFEILQSREQYESACCSIFKNDGSATVLKFDVLPWKYFPGFTKTKFDKETFLGDMMKLFSHGFTDEDKMKYWKVQRIRWHPDKFLQKCGQRLDEKDRGRILELVKSMSQRINSEIAKFS